MRKADQVASALMRRIVEGGESPGAILPTETQLSGEFGVNRSVVREAVKLLEVHRLVRPVRRRGTEVLNPLASFSPAVIRTMLFVEPGIVDQDVLADILEIRAGLDRDMSALAALRRDEEDLEKLDACIARIRDAMSDPRRYAATINELPLLIARASKNRIFEMLVHWHHDIYIDLEEILASVRVPNETHIQGLTLLVEMIRAQDADAVRDAVDAYHQWATPRIRATAALKSGAPLEEIMKENKR